MRYWWVNHKQTFKQEFFGKYIWAPKRKANGARNRFYDNMRLVAPGDYIFSYADGRVQGGGIALSIALDAPKPTEFEGDFVWNESGWRINVDFQRFDSPLHIKPIYPIIGEYFPPKYSPINGKGEGNQGCYLAEISLDLFAEIQKLVGFSQQALLVNEEGKDLFSWQKKEWEDNLERTVHTSELTETEKMAIVQSRRGQGRFRNDLMQVEHECRITHIDNPDYLIASHIRPWRHSDNTQRLDGENGLLLCPNIDLLFDRGLISFKNNGEVIISSVADKTNVAKMDVIVDRTMNVGNFTNKQQEYLEYHRDKILLEVS
jgi:HNH endonuclease